jgi:hypothetical protein
MSCAGRIVCLHKVCTQLHTVPVHCPVSDTPCSQICCGFSMPVSCNDTYEEMDIDEDIYPGAYGNECESLCDQIVARGRSCLALDIDDAAKKATWLLIVSELTEIWFGCSSAKEDVQQSMTRCGPLPKLAYMAGACFLEDMIDPQFGLEWALCVLSLLPNDCARQCQHANLGCAFMCGRHMRLEPLWNRCRYRIRCRTCGAHLCKPKHSSYCSDRCYYRGEY